MDTNKTMMQYFEWYLPNDGLWWKRCAAKAPNLADLGITDIWLPPAYKAISQDDVGYAVYDTYDLGEFDQKGTVRTKYGTKDEYLEAISAFHDSGIRVYADIVLNHRMEGDETEDVYAVTDAPENRNEQVGDEELIRVRSRFTFPGRNGMYSKFTWNRTHFSGADQNELSDETGKIYRFSGKTWETDTDPENGNFDYLMGLNVDMENPEVVEETRKWLLWYLKITGTDALRLDAVKHISFTFYRDLLQYIREETQKELPAVGEYWNGDTDRLLYYLDSVENSMSLFDVPLHYRFYQADLEGENYDLRGIFDNTLVSRRPECAVTFVDNHDTQNGQSLQSFVSHHFKQLAYAIILLREAGTPCVFYTDYYGNSAQRRPQILNLGKLIHLRHDYAYGAQDDYFDDPHIVGWVRRGDLEHKGSGLAAVISNTCDGQKHMFVGTENSGKAYYDALGNCQEPVVIGEDGFGDFKTLGKSVSVWVRKDAFEDLVVNE